MSHVHARIMSSSHITFYTPFMFSVKFMPGYFTFFPQEYFLRIVSPIIANLEGNY